VDAVEARDLTFSYEVSDGAESRPALDSVTFTIPEGQYCFIMGRSGAGKSTLCFALNGLVPHFHKGEYSGSVTVFGRPLADLRVADAAETVGLVFQDFEAQLFSSRAELEVAFAPENLGAERTEIEKRVRRALEQTGLTGFERRHPSNLSGGEKQRLAIASVLSAEPRLLVLDEPTTDLDPLGKHEVLASVRAQREEGRTIVIVDHETEEAVDADRLVIMAEGRIVFDGPPRDVLGDPDFLRQHGIMPLPVTELCRSLGIREMPLTVDECVDLLRSEGWKIDRTSGGQGGPDASEDVSAASEGTPPFGDEAARSSNGEAARPGASEAARPSSEQRARSADNEGAPPTNDEATPRARGASDAACERGAAGGREMASGPDVGPQTDARAGRDAGPLIDVRSVEYRYDGGQEALRGVDLAIMPGEFLALVGHNGSGKTTLVQQFNGLLTPTRGRVVVKGRRTEEWRRSELAAVVGYVFQNPDHQLFASTIEEEVSFGPRNFGIDEAEIRTRVGEALEAVGLSGREQEDPFSLTKGERQRVAVASVLASRPEALILDEPTTGLDFTETERMMDMVAGLNRQGYTVIVVTHSMWVASRYAKRMVVMEKGSILLDGPTRSVLEREEILREARLRRPQIVELSARLGRVACTVEELRSYLKKSV